MMTDKGDKFTDRYIDYAAHLLSAYKGKEPFHIYLKRYFKENRKHGSRDRRNIKDLCYTYFRLYHGFAPNLSIEDKLRFCFQYLADTGVINKGNIFRIENIFPFRSHLSAEIQKDEFTKSLLLQPDLYLRIRPGYTDKIIEELKEKEIGFELISDECVRLQSGIAVEKFLAIDKEVVIQDMNSQKTGDLLKQIPRGEQRLSVWDACAGSGGKSILLNDILGNISLTVSDIRPGILKNLKKRLSKASVPIKDYFIANLSHPFKSVANHTFDIILADLPCSGSGTWARTPEIPVYFNEKEIEKYVLRQRSIISNCLPKLKTGGYLVYLTCSVFGEENEKNIEFLLQNHSLELVCKNYFTGYDNGADTLFGALMVKK